LHSPPPAALCIRVDGADVPACPGQSLAAALLAAGLRRLRRAPRTGAPRGAFCMMGVCQECLVRVDGQVAQACMTQVVAGMSVALDL
jgi:predicted molibdopterin-dependent oxidoreductase YjgC